MENVVAKPKLHLPQSDKTSAGKVSTIHSPSNDENNIQAEKPEVSARSSNEENKVGAEVEAEKPSAIQEHAADDESVYAHSEDGSARSPHVSPRRSIFESSSLELQSKQFGMHNISPHAKDSQRYAA